MGSYQLTPEQQQFWQTHGFLKLDDFFTETQKEQFLAYCDEVSQWLPTKGKWMHYHETNAQGEQQICRVENFLDFHPELDKFTRGARTMQLLADLMGEPAVLFKEKINFKYPGANGFTPHQDAPAFVSFNQKYHITMMMAIDASTLENGCLQIIKDHPFRDELLPQNSDGSIADEYVKNFAWEPLPCAPGDVLLFDSYVPHYSQANLSNRSRRALFATFNRLSEGGDCRQGYYADKRKNFPPEIEREPGVDYSQGAKIYNVANPVGVEG